MLRRQLQIRIGRWYQSTRHANGWAASMVITNSTSRIWSTQRSTCRAVLSLARSRVGWWKVWTGNCFTNFCRAPTARVAIFCAFDRSALTPAREVVVVTRPGIKSTTPVEGCAFVDRQLVHRIGNILPLTLTGGSGQLVTSQRRLHRHRPATSAAALHIAPVLL